MRARILPWRQAADFHQLDGTAPAGDRDRAVERIATSSPERVVRANLADQHQFALIDVDGDHLYGADRAQDLHGRR